MRYLSYLAVMSAFVILTKSVRTENSPKNCLATWHIERHANPWSGLTGDAAAEEATFTVRTQSTKSDAPNVLKQPAVVQAGDFILYRAEKGRAVFVNPAYFGELNRVEVTGRALRNDGKIGKATAKALRQWSPIEILGLLIELQVIITYAHIESNICLVRAEENDGIFKAELSGEHVYYTNSRNVSKFSFVFELNRRTGEMRVMP